MADLKFDIDAFDTAINKYEAIAKALSDIKVNMEEAMTDLESGWKTPAGVAFRDMYNDNWAKHVDQYVAVLNKLAELLGKAKKDYQELENQIPKLFN